jgi:hypothetical protein
MAQPGCTQLEFPGGATVTPGAATLDELLHGARGLGLFDELVDVREPIRLAFRQKHSIDGCARYVSSAVEKIVRYLNAYSSYCV